MRCKLLVLIVMLSTVVVLMTGLSYAWRGIERPENEYLWVLVAIMTVVSLGVERRCRQELVSRVRIVPSGRVILPLVGGVGLGLLVLRWVNPKMFLHLSVGFTLPLSLLLLLLFVTLEDKKHASTG